MKSYDSMGPAIWGGLLLGCMAFMFFCFLREYTASQQMDRLEAVCQEAGGVPARIKPEVLCFAPEAFNGEPK